MINASKNLGASALNGIFKAVDGCGDVMRAFNSDDAAFADMGGGLRAGCDRAWRNQQERGEDVLNESDHRFDLSGNIQLSHSTDLLEHSGGLCPSHPCYALKCLRYVRRLAKKRPC
jgi:hypothetical protein